MGASKENLYPAIASAIATLVLLTKNYVRSLAFLLVYIKMYSPVMEMILVVPPQKFIVER